MNGLYEWFERGKWLDDDWGMTKRKLEKHNFDDIQATGILMIMTFPTEFQMRTMLLEYESLCLHQEWGSVM